MTAIQASPRCLDTPDPVGKPGEPAIANGHRLITRPAVVPLCLAALIAMSALVLFTRLGERMLLGDEALYALIIDRMVETGDWLHPHLRAGEPHLHKPPLYYWLSCSTYFLFGDDPIACRFWSAFFGCGCVLLTFVVGRSLFNSGVGFLAGLLLLTNRHFVFLHGARAGVMDTGVTFLFLLSFLLCWHLRENRWPWVKWTFVGICAGAATLLKPFFGLIPLTIVCLYQLLVCRTAPMRRRLAGVLLAGGVCLALASPWHVLQMVQLPGRFVDEYFHCNVVARVVEGLDPAHVRGPEFYFVDMASSSACFALAVPALALSAACVLCRIARAQLVMLGAFVVPYLALLTVSTSKLSWYAYPAYPLIAILIASVALIGLPALGARLLRPVPLIVVRRLAVGVMLLLCLAAFVDFLSYRIPRHCHKRYLPLTLYRQLEPAVAQGRRRVVCFRFSRPDPITHGWSVVYYGKRMPRAVCVDNLDNLSSLLADGVPTLLLLATARDAELIGADPHLGRVLEVTSIGPARWSFPIARSGPTLTCAKDKPAH